eukprot:1478268-Prymnesium_polylepis.2
MPVADKWYPAFVESLPSLEGKCIAITGTTSGTGFVCALTAVQKGAAAVLLLNRASSRATEADKLIVEAAEGSKTAVHSVVCDLMSLDSAKKAAEETVKLANKFGGLDVFAENAGIMAMPDDRSAPRTEQRGTAPRPRFRFRRPLPSSALLLTHTAGSERWLRRPDP